MGLHLSYYLAADAGAEPAALLEPLRTFASTLPFASVGDLVSGPQPGTPEPGSSWYLPVDEEGQIRPRGWTPGDGEFPDEVQVRATEWTCFRVGPGIGCETAYFGLARHPAIRTVEGKPRHTGLDQSWRWHCSC